MKPLKDRIQGTYCRIDGVEYVEALLTMEEHLWVSRNLDFMKIPKDIFLSIEGMMIPTAVSIDCIGNLLNTKFGDDK